MLAMRRLPNLKGEKPMKNNIAVLRVPVVLLILAAGCAGGPNPYSQGASPDMNVKDRVAVPPMDPRRKVDEQDCSRPIETAGGNLMCRGEPSEAQKRAMREEEERLARARKEAADRAARERAERERAEREAREAAERLERERLAAEQARLEAERRRLEAERLAKLEEEERQARAKKEAEERAAREAAERERAEREAREAAERERQRLEEEWLAGRAYLEKFVATYGNVPKFKGVAGQINGFLDKTR